MFCMFFYHCEYLFFLLNYKNASSLDTINGIQQVTSSITDANGGTFNLFNFYNVFRNHRRIS